MAFDTTLLVYAFAACTLTLVISLIAEKVVGDDLVLFCSALVLAGGELVVWLGWALGENAAALHQGIGLFVGIAALLTAKGTGMLIEWVRG